MSSPIILLKSFFCLINRKLIESPQKVEQNFFIFFVDNSFFVRYSRYCSDEHNLIDAIVVQLVVRHLAKVEVAGYESRLSLFVRLMIFISLFFHSCKFLIKLLIKSKAPICQSCAKYTKRDPLSLFLSKA